jgi:hypothetical protein
MTLGDGEMGTPVPRGYCVCFWQEPILAKIRYSGRKMGEFVYLFVYLAGVERRKFRTARGAIWSPGEEKRRVASL